MSDRRRPSSDVGRGVTCACVNASVGKGFASSLWTLGVLIVFRSVLYPIRGSRVCVMMKLFYGTGTDKPEGPYWRDYGRCVKSRHSMPLDLPYEYSSNST